MTPGIKTTAFWMTVGQLVLSTAVLISVMVRVDASYFEGVLATTAGAIVKLVADAVVVIFYIRSRTAPTAAPLLRPRVSYGECPTDEELPF